LSARVLNVAYHAVSSTWRSPLAIDEEALAQQLSLLARRGYVGLTAAEAERRRHAGTLPSRTVVITFDDGFRSVLRALPVLERLGFPATIFVVTAFVDSGNPLWWSGIQPSAAASHNGELTPLNWSDLESLQAMGWEIGSHTLSHALLPDLPDASLRRELRESRRRIADALGRCDTLAYPYGRADARVVAEAATAGYAAAFALGRVHRPDQPFHRPRLEPAVRGGTPRLRLQLSPLAERVRRSRGAASAQRLVRAIQPRRSWLPPQP
jgi:peptidoglycan/xylan/chitin deacetylase (PgdA/CDA1 family)